MRVELDVESTSPLRGQLSIDGGPLQAFNGWGELRRHISGEEVDLRTLTEQERRVVDLARDGLSNPEIGEALYLSPRTVQWHLTRAFKKLGVRSRAELLARWVR